MASGSVLAEDLIPQAWDLSYPVSSDRLADARARHYIKGMVEAFGDEYYDYGVPLSEFISLSERSLPESERIPRDELIALLRRGIVLDLREADGYPENFYDYQGMIFRLHATNLQMQKSLVFSMRESELGRTVGRLVPENRISEEGLDWLLNASGADGDSVSESCRFLEELGMEQNAIGTNVELLGIGRKKLEERIGSLEDLFDLDRQKILKSPRVLLRTPRQIEESLRALGDFGLKAEDVLPFLSLLSVSEENLRDRSDFLAANNPDAESDPALLGMHDRILRERLDYLTMRAGMDAQTVWSNYELLHMSRKTLREKTELIRAGNSSRGAQPDEFESFARENPRLWLEPLSKLRGKVRRPEEELEDLHKMSQSPYFRNEQGVDRVGLTAYNNRKHHGGEKIRTEGQMTSSLSRYRAKLRKAGREIKLDEDAESFLECLLAAETEGNGLEEFTARFNSSGSSNLTPLEMRKKVENLMAAPYESLVQERRLRTESRRKKRIAGLIALGKVPWYEERLEDLHKMSQSVYFKRGGQSDLIKLAAYDNRKNHGGKRVRTELQLTNALTKYRRNLEEEGKEIKLSEDAESFLECLLAAETEGDNLEEFTARFNSSGNSNLTPLEMRKKVENLMAAPYESLVHEQRLRTYRRRNDDMERVATLGEVLWSREEAEDVHKMRQSPYFRSGRRLDLEKLTDWDNRKYHGGKRVRTKKKISRLPKYLMDLEKAGKGMKLDHETASLLECMLTAERKSYGIRKFADEFNSANGSNLTPKELEKKVEEVLAASYNDLISGHNRKRRSVPWSEEELEDLCRMMQSPYFRNEQGVDRVKLTAYANRKHHGGKQVRKASKMSYRMLTYRRKLEKEGREITLDEDTGSFLECLLAAETEGDGLEEFTARFNSSGNSNLTPLEMGKKVENLMAAPYDDLISERKRRNNSGYVRWPEAELEDMHKMWQSPYFRNYKGADLSKLADWGNRKYHGGKRVRKSSTLRTRLQKYRRQLAEEGREIKLDPETASLLDCLMTAERKSYGIRKFADEFNSASGLNLTPKELEEKVENLMAVPYDDLISEHKRNTISRGGWPEAELEDLHRMTQSPYFRNASGMDIAKLTAYDNRKHHGGENVRTEKKMSLRMSQYRRKLEKEGREIKLDPETASLLDCLMTAERKSYGIQKFADEFNSANGSNLTPKELEEKVENLMAASYNDLISERKRRNKSGYVWWPEEELEDMHRMKQSPYFRKAGGADLEKLTAYANRKHHGGEKVRTAASLSTRMQKYRGQLAEEGREIKLDPETASLLDCLMVAEKEGYGIQEFADRFNSDNDASKTPKELKRALEETLAMPYEKLVPPSFSRLPQERHASPEQRSPPA